MIEILESAITSPWVYVALFAIAVLDGFFPVVPSETMVITAGVFAAGGEPELVPAANTLAVRGGLLLVVARYVPGGRTAATMTTGAVGYPRRKFALFDALAAGSWGLYSALVGYLGGAAFEHDKLKGLLFGLGLAATVTVLVELARHLRRRRARRTPDQLAEPSSISPAS